jgi:hypothetical protein
MIQKGTGRQLVEKYAAAYEIPDYMWERTLAEVGLSAQEFFAAVYPKEDVSAFTHVPDSCNVSTGDEDDKVDPILPPGNDDTNEDKSNSNEAKKAKVKPTLQRQGTLRLASQLAKLKRDVENSEKDEEAGLPYWTRKSSSSAKRHPDAHHKRRLKNLRYPYIRLCRI